ncbi:MAG TPA: hypothetical protein VIR32_00700 [Lachnospiraceae bacterium]
MWYRKAVLVITTYIMGGVFILSGFLANLSGWLSIVGFAGMTVSTFWLISFMLVNYEFLFEKEKDHC